MLCMDLKSKQKCLLSNTPQFQLHALRVNSEQPGLAIPQSQLDSHLVETLACHILKLLLTSTWAPGFSGMEWWTGMVEWNGGMEWWNGMVEWNGGLE